MNKKELELIKNVDIEDLSKIKEIMRNICSRHKNCEECPLDTDEIDCVYIRTKYKNL